MAPLNHVVPLLWRFHNVHHIDPDLDVTTAARARSPSPPVVRGYSDLVRGAGIGLAVRWAAAFADEVVVADPRSPNGAAWAISSSGKERFRRSFGDRTQSARAAPHDGRARAGVYRDP